MFQYLRSVGIGHLALEYVKREQQVPGSGWNDQYGYEDQIEVKNQVSVQYDSLDLQVWYSFYVRYQFGTQT